MYFKSQNLGCVLNSICIKKILDDEEKKEINSLYYSNKNNHLVWLCLVTFYILHKASCMRRHSIYYLLFKYNFETSKAYYLSAKKKKNRRKILNLSFALDRIQDFCCCCCWWKIYRLWHNKIGTYSACI